MNDIVKEPIENKTPQEYFDYLKGKKVKVTDLELQNVYENGLRLLNKYETTGQIAAMKKLIFQLDTIEKERELIKLGVDTFVYKDDIETYIDDIAKNVVKIIELCRYEREIPDEIVETVSKTKHLFNQYYIVFTDYTGKVEKQVAKERREKDPILFGTFQDDANRTMVDRFYFLGDWVDEYCDLTLDKMVAEIKNKKDKDIEMKISTPKDIEELKAQINNLELKNGHYIMKKPNPEPLKNKSFFSKVRSVFKR